jgi:glycosyltransferase involved in cell wall biosynthesis
MQEPLTEKLQPIELLPLPENPLVSVLIGNYNYARYIGETLESVLCQTYPHFEVIVCDDGSKDNSCEVIETYVQKDSRIKLIRKQNGGVATAWNTAYRESKGQIICILDADDLWMPNKLQKVVEIFISEPKSGFVIHNVTQIDGDGNFIKPKPMFRRLASGWMAPFALQNGGFVGDIPPASALSIRHEVASYIFPINEAFVRNSDSLIIYLSPLITVIGSVPEVLSKFRLHATNTSSQLTLTADFVEREQASHVRVHQEQKRLLKEVYGLEIAQRLTDLQSSIGICFNLYIIARLRGVSKVECAKAHQQLITHPQFATQFNWFRPHRWLLQWNLPDMLFTILFNQVYGLSPLKRLVRNLNWQFLRDQKYNKQRKTQYTL